MRNNSPQAQCRPSTLFGSAVDTLDLAEMRFDGVESAATGRPSYHPSVVLKLYIYGYLNQTLCLPSEGGKADAGPGNDTLEVFGKRIRYAWSPDYRGLRSFLSKLFN